MARSPRKTSRRSGTRPNRDPDAPLAVADDARHIPVLLAEVIAALEPRPAERHIDATFGAGGYTRAILEASDCQVLAFDRDPTAIAGAQRTLGEFAPRLSLRHAPFSTLLELASDPAEVGGWDGVVFDLGVSSMQIDAADRGFSFQQDGPLDMRMSAAAAFHDGADPANAGPSAADVVATASEAALADILFHLGEERRSRSVAKAIVARREAAPFTRTLDLADVIARVVGRKPGDRIHPATRSFQALRMYVNDELGELARGLAGAERLLKPGGRLVVVTFHSLEDRVVKRFFAERAGKSARGSRHLPDAGGPTVPPSLEIVNPSPLTSSQGEAEVNPRARSARLRAGRRTNADPWPFEADDLEALGVPRLPR
ncbi:MAG: 16S rRNA (cytosine(1402)-N(4))-methyltransferase RsmH [Hyphomicrobiaceae bacterium]|nr:16S rRNA (cytosine(1402)-N(4))-methyltransferase RsmH [Hyphomicrobiaceae bacterium]